MSLLVYEEGTRRTAARGSISKKTGGPDAPRSGPVSIRHRRVFSPLQHEGDPRRVVSLPEGLPDDV